MSLDKKVTFHHSSMVYLDDIATEIHNNCTFKQIEDICYTLMADNRDFNIRSLIKRLEKLQEDFK